MAKLFSTEEEEQAALQRYAEYLNGYGINQRQLTNLPVEGIHEYNPGYTANEIIASEDRRNPKVWFPSYHAAQEEARIKRETGWKPGRTYNTLSGTVREGPEREQTWAERMVRSGVSLPTDVMAGTVLTGPGLRPGDYSDIPGAPQPLANLIERAQDTAGLAAGGSVAATGLKAEKPGVLARGATKLKDRLKQFLAEDAEAGTGLSAVRNTASEGSSLSQRLNEHLNGSNETMPQILARQRASEGYEAAIRDSETKQIYSGMWHEEVIDKIAKERGVPRSEINNLVSSPEKGNLVKGYINDRGRFLTEDAVEKLSQAKSKSKTAMFRSDDEVGTALSAIQKGWEDKGIRNYVSNKGDTITLHDLVIPKEQRSQGIGSQYLKDLTKVADESGKTIVLTAAKDYGTTSLNRLKDFYKEAGFVENKGRNKDFTISGNMYRKPILLSDDIVGTGLAAAVVDRLRPALRNKENGEIIHGKRGELHGDLAEKNNIGFRNKGPLEEQGYINHENGLYDPKEKKFYKSSDVNIDSSDLMTNTQRMRKFSTFSDDMVGTGLVAAAPRFYSGVEKVVTNTKGEKLAPDQWLGPKTERTYIDKNTGKTVTEVKYSGTIGNMPGITVEEIEHLKLPEWIADQKQAGKKSISKKELLDHINENKVELQETWKGKHSEEQIAAMRKREQELIGKGKNATEAEKQEWADIQNKLTSVGQPRFAQYQLPGGTNYRELLLSVKDNPKKLQRVEEINNEIARIDQELKGKVNDWENKLGPHYKALKEKKYALAGERMDLEQAFTHEHWPGAKDVFAHSRMNDRIIPDETGPSYKDVTIKKTDSDINPYQLLNNDGKVLFKGKTKEEVEQYANNVSTRGYNTLHVEEFQSDVHQQGHTEGYKLPNDVKKKLEPEFDRIEEKIIASGDEAVMSNPEIKDAVKLAVDKKIITADEAKTYLRYADSERLGAVKELPFKNTWLDLKLKRLIRQAAEEGKDAISWTPGEVHVDRYNLRKYVDQIEYMKNEDGTIELELKGKNGENIPTSEKYYTKDNLHRFIGKEMAAKIIKDEGKKSGNKSILEGEDLEVGGEFHKKLYDEIAVSKANAIAKKYGGRVEEKTLPITKKDRPPAQDIVRELGYTNEQWRNLTQEERAAKIANSNHAQKIWVLKLTPELKKAALERGFSMFETGLPLPTNNNEQTKYRLIPVSHNPFVNPRLM